jgi:predicted DsbA family dithiol-disulfide isomerase
MRIDFVSDIACPWWAVGLNPLEAALARLGDAIPVELHLQPFELNPALPPEGDDTVAYLSRKYGIGPEQIARNRATLRELAARVGLDARRADEGIAGGGLRISAARRAAASLRRGPAAGAAA